MRMENESENFEQLRRLLALKKHELPPPGYFNRFSGQVIERLQAERNADVLSKLNTEAPWLARLWQTLAGKPAFAGMFGAAVCAILLGGIFLAEKPAETSSFADAVQHPAESPFMAASPVNTGANLNQPLLTSTNPAGGSVPNLFEMFQPYPGQAQTVSAPASGN